MEENEIKPEDLKLSDKLAVERTVLAADRTMLAGVRTSLSFIGFGFTIFNVLRYVQEHSPAKIMRPETPRNVALFMLVAGTVPFVCHDDSILPVIEADGERERLDEPELPDGRRNFFAWDDSLGHSYRGHYSAVKES